MKSKWMDTVLKMNAVNYPDKVGWQDKTQAFSFQQWKERSCRLANALKALGVKPGDRFAVIAYNRGEWMDIYDGCAKGGQIIVPIMFRLTPPEIEYIVNHSECNAFMVEAPFVEKINLIKDKLPVDAYIYLGHEPVPDGYIRYEHFISRSTPEEPDRIVDAADTWTIMYTSGTTGKPKGVVRSHESYMAEYFVQNINMGVRPDDKVMLVMPMCHVNSIFYSFSYVEEKVRSHQVSHTVPYGTIHERSNDDH